MAERRAPSKSPLKLATTIQETSSLAALLAELRALLGARLESQLRGANVLTALDEAAFQHPTLFACLPQTPTVEERILVVLALVPHLQPNFFEALILEHLPSGGDLPELGGVKGVQHRGMLPTGETAQFVLAGNNLDTRLPVRRYFSEDHYFAGSGVLSLESVREGEPIMSGRLLLSQEWVDRMLLQRETTPRFGADFPARRIETNMLWEDAVLNARTLQQVKDLSDWIAHHPRLASDENLGRKVKPGYRVLFYGPPGTGKTLTAALLGKQFGRPVYRIDLSQVVSKYIGETEKNLEGIFKRAQSKDWILFFDESDALFGKRTNVQSAHDKYANQEVSYLLQRIEDHPGLLVLASNFKSNLDDAFLRRFHALVHFPMPNVSERLILWRKSLPTGLAHDPSIDLAELAKKYEMSGAAILNAVQHAALRVYANGGNSITHSDLIEGLRREFQKEEKVI